MSFPGDRAVYQFPRSAVIEDFEMTVIPEGEFVVYMDPDNTDAWELRIGDGVTVGGVVFATKAYIDAMTAGSGVAAGDDATAIAGVDTTQRSWPATAFGLKADKNNTILIGVPTAPTAAIGVATSQLATTLFVANGFKVKGSTSTDPDEVNFPVGHVLVADRDGNACVRNGLPAATLRLDGTSSYKLGGVGAALSGVWRGRGVIVIAGGSNHNQLERVS